MKKHRFNNYYYIYIKLKNKDMENVDFGEIVLCNLKLKPIKKESFYLKDVIFSNPYEKKRFELIYSNRNDRRLIDLTGFKEDLKIINIEVISRHGFKNKSKGFTLAKKSDNSRNKITGTYE